MAISKPTPKPTTKEIQALTEHVLGDLLDADLVKALALRIKQETPDLCLTDILKGTMSFYLNNEHALYASISNTRKLKYEDKI